MNKLSPSTRLGYVHLNVANLERQIEFYTKIIGLSVHWQKDKQAGLGVGADDLLRLTEIEDAKRYPASTGLYHQAFLLPEKKELARAIARIDKHNYPQSPTDHTISWTTYLEDAEGNTVELYVATPEEGTWDSNDEEFIVFDKHGNRKTGVDPLDVDHLMSYLSPNDEIEQPMPAGTITGHVHLYMNDLHKAMYFYSDVLGFHRKSLVSRFRMGETILPGYDVHIIAFNDWKGSKARPAPSPSTGLSYYTINLTSQADLDMILRNLEREHVTYEKSPDGVWTEDPVHNRILLTIESQ